LAEGLDTAANTAMGPRTRKTSSMSPPADLEEYVRMRQQENSKNIALGAALSTPGAALTGLGLGGVGKFLLSAMGDPAARGQQKLVDEALANAPKGNGKVAWLAGLGGVAGILGGELLAQAPNRALPLASAASRQQEGVDPGFLSPTSKAGTMTNHLPAAMLGGFMGGYPFGRSGAIAGSAVGGGLSFLTKLLRDIDLQEQAARNDWSAYAAGNSGAGQPL
jgi:hypothetical protein